MLAELADKGLCCHLAACQHCWGHWRLRLASAEAGGLFQWSCQGLVLTRKGGGRS